MTPLQGRFLDTQYAAYDHIDHILAQQHSDYHCFNKGHQAIQSMYDNSWNVSYTQIFTNREFHAFTNQKANSFKANTVELQYCSFNRHNHCSSKLFVEYM